VGRIPEAPTFDDVLLGPESSQVLPRDAELRTRLTRMRIGGSSGVCARGPAIR
jgi:IMP dehydrogenase/GMP reductase